MADDVQFEDDFAITAGGQFNFRHGSRRGIWKVGCVTARGILQLKRPATAIINVNIEDIRIKGIRIDASDEGEVAAIARIGLIIRVGLNNALRGCMCRRSSR